MYYETNNFFFSKIFFTIKKKKAKILNLRYSYLKKKKLKIFINNIFIICESSSEYI